MRGEKTDREHREKMIDAAHRMHKTVRDAVCVADANMGEGERRGEGEEKGEQRFHEDLGSEVQ
jgi:hypothetical protein